MAGYGKWCFHPNIAMVPQHEPPVDVVNVTNML